MMILAPSLLAADQSQLAKELEKAKEMGAKYIHIDIMDGFFVKNKTWDPSYVEKIAGMSDLFKDVHIMVKDPQVQAPLFAKAGADNVTFHLEACANAEEVIDIIDNLRKRGVSSGLSIKPLTPVDDILPYVEYLDMVLIMSVEPGEGGQAFLPNALDKIAVIRKYIDEHNYRCLIEVDGGINEKSGRQCLEAGADVLVSGSYLFGHDDYLERARRLFEDD